MPVNRALLITRPDHETVTKCLCLWSEAVKEFAEHKGIIVYDLKGKKANRKEFESYLSKNRPALLFLNGHGNAEIITGYDDYPLVDSSSSMPECIVYGRSCDAALFLGPYLVQKGTRTFIGYCRKFILGYSLEKIMRPLEDHIARLFLEPSNLVITTLLKGNTTSEAHRRSRAEMYKNFIKMLASTSSYEERHAAPWLWSNFNSQILLGDANACIDL